MNIISSDDFSHLAPQLAIVMGLLLADRLLPMKKKITLVFSGEKGKFRGDFHRG